MNPNERSVVPVAQRSFNQQGSIDWVNLLKSSLSWIVEVLARLSAANVDAYTVVVGQAISHNFRLGPNGRRNVVQALEQSKIYGSIGNAIWFGIGVQSLVRTLGQTEEGTSLVALCSALGACFHHELAAEVLHSMAKSYDPPNNLSPSILQWLELVKSCAGLFAGTDFPTDAERLMSLGPSSSRFTTYNASIEPGISGRGFPVSSDLAEALIGLCKVSCNEFSTITITGGPVCGWLAAVAVWLLDLSVTISYDGKILYSNNDNHAEAQIQLIFHKEQLPDSMEIETINSTYILRNSADFLHLDEEGAIITTMTGRLHWNTCLLDAFGKEFENLMKTPSLVGRSLGCIARFFSAIAAGESEIDQQVTHDWQSYFDSSNGQGFVENTIQWFPQLRAAQAHMHSGAKLTLSNAMKEYENQIAILEQICSCHLCRRNVEEEYYSDAFCLVIVLETIAILSLALSGMSVQEGIRPTRAGFEIFYSNLQLSRIIDSQNDSIKPSKIGPFYYILQTLSTSNDRDVNIAENRLRDAAKLFIGRDSWESLRFETTALSRNGICIYSGVLKDKELSLSRESFNRVYIVAGRIERDAKPYDLVVDRKCPNAPPSFEQLLNLSDVSLVVEEKVRSLALSFKFSNKRSVSVHIEPAELLNAVRCARGLFSCRRYNCPKVISIEDDRHENFQEYHLLGKKIAIYQGNTLFQSTMLYLNSIHLPEKRRCILRTNECIQCSLLAASKMEDTEHVVIIS